MSNSGQLFGILTAFFLILFSLFPDSHSLMVSWPWVFMWQIGLFCPILWWLVTTWTKQQFSPLGNGLDWISGFTLFTIIVSTIFAQFHPQAIWYGWAGICAIAGLYSFNSWLTSTQRRYQILIAQGYLNLTFIIWSLFLWITQTLTPELQRISELKTQGIEIKFDFSVLELRNWAPLGHQNYVAGYLLLALPLLTALSILEKGNKKIIWVMGLILGLINLYTTSSRGGWLGLILLVVAVFMILLWQSSIPRMWLLITGGGSFALLLGLVFANNRLNSLIFSVFRGEGEGEFAYRWINAIIGGKMGADYPLTGVGLGGIPLLYQKYRPAWAGRESEMAFQLHSTPVQLWAEMGIGGIIIMISLVTLLIYLLWNFLQKNKQEITIDKRDFILVWALYGGLFAYGIMSLTDYQLDNICITATIVLYIAVLANIFQESNLNYFSSKKITNFFNKKTYFNSLFFGIIGIILIMIINLIPIHRAWQISSEGFWYLREKEPNYVNFVDNLTQAEKLTPWEAYYPYQLGWNLGDLALQTNNLEQKNQLLQEAINWFEKGNKNSPYNEFGRSNLGWLLINIDPQLALQEFKKSAQLIPAKRGVFYGLGLSLALQQKNDLAIEALSLEIMRDPLFITSPIWRISLLKSLEEKVLTKTIQSYNLLLENEPNNPYLHQCRGAIAWWKGDLLLAHQDWDQFGNSLSKTILALAENKDINNQINDLSLSNQLLIKTWLSPQDSLTTLQQSLFLATQTKFPPEIEKQLIQEIEENPEFIDWIKNTNFINKYRRQRSGFGVISRHIDGIIPTDFLQVVDNNIVTLWLDSLFPSLYYSPDLDRQLQPLRDSLIK
jgi:uncharacterized protein involved in response to NO